MRRALLLLLFTFAAQAQISPGKLSEPHAKLEGASNCFQCHEPGKGVSAQRCFSCHKALAARVAAKRGLHAQPNFRQKCERCHNEHHGRAFQLIHWNPKALDHRVTGFPLVGAHAKLECKQCHKTRSYLGLSQNCTSCHRDPHKGQFGTRACTSCHAMTAWKPPSLFKHTTFPLTGKHAQVACAKCHANGVYRPVKHQSCTDCHKDPHAGRMGSSCATCHSTAGFKPVTKFDHGAIPKQPCTNCHKDPHAGRFGSSCANCHTTTSFTAVKFDHSRVPKQPCVNCHKKRDAHAGRLGNSCERCHSTGGWRPARRENFDHAMTRFPLAGKHRTTACVSCHRESSVRAPMACSACHRDPHAGRFGTACERCHTPTSFKNVTAGAFDHDRTRFPLVGAHKRAACATCHERWKKPPLTCAGCHTDPHKKQLGTECARCHSVERFLPSTFTIAAHEKTKFPLAGAHLAVPCNACHARGVFRFASTDCQSCHKNPHGTAVTGACTSCHRVEAWTRIVYAHRTFPLEGAHAKVRCGACHTNLAKFTGTPRKCAACHSGVRQR